MVRAAAGNRKQLENAAFESFNRRVPEGTVPSKPVQECIEMFAVLHLRL